MRLPFRSAARSGTQIPPARRNCRGRAASVIPTLRVGSPPVPLANHHVRTSDPTSAPLLHLPQARAPSATRQSLLSLYLVSGAPPTGQRAARPFRDDLSR